MALSARLEIRQSQQLVMTPQLQQAIKLLQLSNIELSQFVEAEIERNPLLEQNANDAGPTSADAQPDAPDQMAIAGQHAASDAPIDDMPAEWAGMQEAQADPAAALDTEYDNVFPDTARCLSALACWPPAINT